MDTVKKQGNYLKFKNITCSLGNGKLDKSILIFNLPSVKTCPNCEDCKAGCYARKAEKLYSTVLPCREKNYQASKQTSFIRDMRTIILKAEKLGVKYIRVHESGDFYSAIYAQCWECIADFFPNLQFFSYTKSSFRPIAQNFNIVESILPDGSINFGSLDTIFKLAKKYHARICPYNMGKAGRKGLCGVKCKACMTSKYVVFLKH